MSTKLGIHFILLLSLFAVALNVSNAEKKAKDSIPTSPKAEDAKRESQNVENPKKEDPEVKSKEDKAEEKQDPDDLEYNKGSLCGYCSYCKVGFFHFAADMNVVIKSNNLMVSNKLFQTKNCLNNFQSGQRKNIFLMNLF